MITIPLEREGAAPLYQQLYLAIRQMIGEGSLKGGEKLPSKRALSAHLKVSIITVETAYGQLQAEGYISSRPGSGFYVESLFPAPKRNTPAEAEAAQNAPAVFPPVKKREERVLYNYSTSGTDVSSFPFSVWQKLSREVLSGNPRELLSPCPSSGAPRLREAISGYLRDFRGMHVDPRQIVVGAGSEYLTGLLIQLLGRERLYGIENPGYPKIAKIFAENGAEVLPLDMDEQGLTLKGAPRLPDVLHLTPAHHFPLGVTMPAGRRSELLAKMTEKNGYIVEDDYDSEFRYKGQILPTLYSMDGGGRVICLGTFTKLLAPSLRISYMILPPALLEEYEKRLSFYACTVPVFEQLTLALFIERGYLERHINRMKKIYKRRRDAILAAFAASRLAPHVSFTGAEAGLHLLLRTDFAQNEEELAARAEEQGVRLTGLGGFYLTPPKKGASRAPSFLLGFTGIRDESIPASVEALEKAWI